MKVVCIGYYDKFARFFIGIKKQLAQTNPKLKFSIISIYLSGYLYSLLRFIPSSLISYQALWRSYFYHKNYKQILSKNSTYKDFAIEQLTQHYYGSKNKKNIQLQALAYIDILEKKIKNINLLLLVGDLRLPVEIAKNLAKRNNIQTYFIEQGPYQTTFFDTKGVNANASIRAYTSIDENGLEEKQVFIRNFIYRNKNKKYRRSPIYRGLDYVLEAFLNKTPFLPPDLKIDYPLLGKNNTSSLNDSNKVQPAFEQTYLLICQVPFDVNMTHHSPFYDNHYQILFDVHKNLPEKSKLIVREHPVYKRKYQKKFYTYIANHHNVVIDHHQDFSKSLNLADVVIVNNSTVGLEAIVKKKTVVVLANSYYDSSGICLKLTHHQNLKDMLLQSLTYKIDETKRVNFLYELFKNHLIEGFITDQRLNATKTIAEAIIRKSLSENNN